MFRATKLTGIIFLCCQNITHQYKKPVRNYHDIELTLELTEQGFAF